MTTKPKKKRHRFNYADGTGTCKDCGLKRWHQVRDGVTDWSEWTYETPEGNQVLPVVPNCPALFNDYSN